MIPDFPVFFSEIPVHDSAILTPEDSLHATKVLRLKSGDNVMIIPGDGKLYTASVQTIHHSKTSVLIHSVVDIPADNVLKPAIAIAPTKMNDRMEWFLEKAVEIGISDIYLLRTERTVRTNINPERWRKIIRAAMKQSLRPMEPKLHEITDFQKFIYIDFNNSIKLIAHCNKSFRAPAISQLQKNRNVLICIGPEGDFSPAEVEKAELSGFVSVSLGESRLRTETAALHSCSMVSVFNSL